MYDETQLLIEWPDPVDVAGQATERLDGADALVIDPCQCGVEQFKTTGVGHAVVRNGAPDRDRVWCEMSSSWSMDGGLDEVARLRDEHPGLLWIPRLAVSRAAVSYRFSGPAVGEGFSFYMPDTGAIKGWQVDGGGTSLQEAVTRATALGFPTLWLHSPEAERNGRGLALDLLDKVRGGPLSIWLSGGVAEPRHLRNLVRAGGAAAVIVSGGLVRDTPVSAWREALAPARSEPEAVPMRFERHPARIG